MNDDNKYHWTFRQTVGWNYKGRPIYHRYSFGSIFSMMRAIVYFNLQMFKRAYRRGWSKRWEIS